MEQKKALVFVHGFLGSNKQFTNIKSMLDGIDADFVDHVVAGHGGTLEEFLQSNDESWQSGLNEHIARLRGEYDKIFLVGHSLGGLLSVRAAVATPEVIGGIVAIAFPIKIKPVTEGMGNNFDAAKPKKDDEDPRVTAARDLSGVEIKSTGDFLRVLPNAVRLLRLIRVTRKELPALKTPLTVIKCAKDGIVSPKAFEYVERVLPSAKRVTAEDSFHFLFSESDEKMMAEEIRSMVFS